MLLSVVSSGVLFWLFLVSSSLGHVQRRDDSYDGIRHIYGVQPTQSLKIEITSSALQVSWDENTAVVVVQGPRQSLNSAIIGVVTGTRGVWMFELGGGEQQNINNFPRTNRDATDVETSKLFKQRFNYAILGDESEYNKYNPPPDSIRLVDVTLTKFLRDQKRDELVHAFLIAREGENNRPYNPALIEAIVSRLKHTLGGLEVQWMPTPFEPPENPYDKLFGLIRIHTNDLPGMFGEVTGQKVGMYYGSKLCLLAKFHDKLLHSDNYLEAGSALVPFDFTPTNPLESELLALWNWADNHGLEGDDRNTFTLLDDEEREDPRGVAVHVDLSTERPLTITKHNNKDGSTLIVTVMTTYGSWTLLLPPTFPMPRPQSLKGLNTRNKPFRNFKKDYLENNGDSIKYNWRWMLKNFKDTLKNHLRPRSVPAKLLNIIIIRKIQNGELKLEYTHKIFFQAMILEMLRIIETENKINAPDDVIALDITNWSVHKYVIFLPVMDKPATQDKEHYFLIHEEKIVQDYEARLSIHEPGHVFEIFYGARFKMKWEIGQLGSTGTYLAYGPEDMTGNMVIFSLDSEEQ